MSRLRLSIAKLVCAGLPPPAAGLVGKRIYPLEQGRRDALRFVRRGQTGSYFTGVTSDFNAHQFAIRGHNEWRNVAIAKALASPGDVIVEIGANVGTETVGFSDVVGATGRVYAFEPLPDNLEALSRTLPLTENDNVVLLPLAVGASAGTVRFAAPPPTARSQGTGHVLGPDERERGVVTYHERDVDWPMIEVEGVTLDSFADRLGPARIVFIDAEGAEVGILDGAKAYIGNHRPVLVLEACADHLVRQGATVERLHATLVELGYQSFAIRRVGLEPLTAPDAGVGAGNWLCVPESSAELARAAEGFLRRCALMPRIGRLNPLSGPGARR